MVIFHLSQFWPIMSMAFTGVGVRSPLPLILNMLPVTVSNLTYVTEYSKKKCSYNFCLMYSENKTRPTIIQKLQQEIQKMISDYKLIICFQHKNEA